MLEENSISFMQRPILTVVVPSYNVEQYLERGLSTYDDPRMEGRLQVVIVNDGSTDSTQEIARRFCEKTPRVFELVNKENGGHGSAINAGISAARGTYFRVIDGDDWVDTDGLAAFLNVLESAEADLVVDVKREIDMMTGDAQVFPFPKSVPQKGVCGFDDVCSCGEIVPFIMIHTLSIRTDYLREIGLKLLEKTFYVDFEYVVKATLDAQSVQFVDINVYQYLVGNANQSVADASYVKRWEDHTRVAEEILRLYGERRNSLPPKRSDYLLRRCVLLCNTHYNIALIFDKDRKRGVRRAREFRAYLRSWYPEVAGLTESRFKLATILHYLGVSSQKELDRFTR